MIYVSAVLIPGFYFDKWRALATGISVCGSGIGTFVLAPLNAVLVESYGWRSTLLVQAGIAFFKVYSLRVLFSSLFSW